MEIKREYFNNKLYIFYTNTRTKPPPSNLIIILNNKNNKKISLPSLSSKINIININNAEVNNSNIYLTFFCPKNPYICNFIKPIIFKIPILSKSPTLSLSKNFFLLINKNVLQHLLFIIN